MNTPVVKVENLVKRYRELVALDHFNLQIEEGEIFGLLGPNGFDFLEQRYFKYLAAESPVPYYVNV